jgi:hypothetical protein
VAAGRRFRANCLACWRSDPIDLVLADEAAADQLLIALLPRHRRTCPHCGSRHVVFASGTGNDELAAPAVFGRFPEPVELARRGRASLALGTRITVVPFGWEYAAGDAGRRPYLDLKADPAQIDALPEVRRARDFAALLPGMRSSAGAALGDALRTINSAPSLETVACAFEAAPIQLADGRRGHATESWIEVLPVDPAADALGQLRAWAEALLAGFADTPPGCHQALGIAYVIREGRVQPGLQAITDVVLPDVRLAFGVWAAAVRKLGKALRATAPSLSAQITTTRAPTDTRP